MKPKWFATAFLMAVLGGGTFLHAQTASELLQKGIYMQETVGDLDAAINLYSQVVQLAKDSRANAAQALYRLGICQQKKGQQADAVKTFQSLIADYPDQTDVVAKARALVPTEAGLKLLPAPWVDGEVLDLQMRSPNGQPGGIFRSSVQSSKTDPDRWLIENRTYDPMMPYSSRVEVDKNTMRPAVAVTRNQTLLGDHRITYFDDRARIEKAGEKLRIVAWEGTVWDYEETLDVMRRLPLAAGYKIPFSFLSPSGFTMTVGLAVTGMEDVQTPAGTFHCYRVELEAINQKFWVSSDSSRYPAKFDNGLYSAELLAIRRVGSQQTPTVYKNEHGYSITLPAGWMVDNREPAGSQISSVQLLDPDSLARISLALAPADPNDIPTTDAIREKAEMHLAGGQKLRPDSWQVRQIGGHPALAWQEDYTEPFTKRPMVRYWVMVWSKTLHAEFVAQIDAKDFDSFRARLDPVIDTLTLK